MFPLRDINPSTKTPWITRSLVIINLIIFSLAFLDPLKYQQLVYQYAAVPYNIIQGLRLHTLITSMFLHGSIIHIGGNMLFLWVFGDNIEDKFGHTRYLLFYLLSGIIAAYIQIIMFPNDKSYLIGASGAISGIIGAYVVLYPRAKILTLITLGYYVRFVNIPAIIYVGIWFLIQFIYGLITLTINIPFGIAYWAHIGGFLFGAISASLSRVLGT
jgi:membrane associated rhomboid family serine protease